MATNTDPCPVLLGIEGTADERHIAEAVFVALDFADVEAIVIDETNGGATRATRAIRAPWQDADVRRIVALVAHLAETDALRRAEPCEIEDVPSGRRVRVTRLQGRAEASVLVAVLAPSVVVPAVGTPEARLTPRQQEVVKAIVNGASVREAAATLGITVSTARRHLEAAHSRLQIRRRAQLVRHWVGLSG